ncbi:MAG: DUF134 domain-containing protein [Bacillota bacterium]|nr:DUF134 domain-containing protein [Bacillota bacterium]
MPRPTKFRKVECFPEECYFVPFGKRDCGEESIELKVEELEAMRLKDIQELSQEECAEKMEVSRQTFQNIIDSARKKVAAALTQGKGIRITGGNYIPKNCVYSCTGCGEVYEPNQENDIHQCPKCGCRIVSCCSSDCSQSKWCNCR